MGAKRILKFCWRTTGEIIIWLKETGAWFPIAVVFVLAVIIAIVLYFSRMGGIL